MNYLLYNPSANNGTGEQMKSQALGVLQRKYGHFKAIDITVNPTQAFILGLKPNDFLVVIGGDGTLNKLVNLVRGQIPTCKAYVYKVGKGNDFLLDNKDYVKDDLLEINGMMQHLPTLSANGKTRLFVNGVGFGLDGEVCAITDQYKKLGQYEKINYAKIAAKLIMNYKRTKATIVADGKTYTFDKTWMVAIMHGKYYGNGMLVAPKQNRKSGKVTVVAIHSASKLKALTRFKKLFTTGITEYQDMVTSIEAKQVSVTFNEPRAIQIDGDLIPRVTSLRVNAH